MDNYKNCVCVFLSKGNGDVLSQRNAGRCVKIGSILNLLLQEATLYTQVYIIFFIFA